MLGPTEETYVLELLDESLAGFSLGPEIRDLGDPSLVTQLQIARWKRDFSRKFGDHLTESLSSQLDFGIQKIQSMNKALESAPGLQAASADESETGTSGPIPTQRPSETLRRMKVEFKAPEEQERLEVHAFNRPSVSPSGERFTTFSSRADKNNLIMAVGALLILLLFGAMMVVGLRHERSIRIRGLQHTLRANLDVSDMEADPEGLDSGKSPDGSSNPSIRDLSADTSSGNSNQSGSNFVPDILKEIPETSKTAPAGNERIDPNLSAGYFAESLVEKLSAARRKQENLKKKSDSLKSQDSTQYQFFPHRPFLLPNQSKKFSVPEAVSGSLASDALPSSTGTNPPSGGGAATPPR